MSSLVPRLPPSFPYDGKLDGDWGTWLVISDSAYELSCAHLPPRQHELRRSKEWPSSKPKWLEMLTQR